MGDDVKFWQLPGSETATSKFSPHGPGTAINTMAWNHNSACARLPFCPPAVLRFATCPQGPCPPHSLSFSDTPSSSRALSADQVLVTGGSDGMICLSHESGHLLGTLPSKRSSVVDPSQVREALRALLQPPCPAAAQPFR